MYLKRVSRDGSGYHETQSDQIPLEARILMVADVYDAAVRSTRRDCPRLRFGIRSEVVDAFVGLFRRGEMDLPRLSDMTELPAS